MTKPGTIQVDQVSMLFNLSRNKEERLKEYVINMLKGQLFFDEFWALKEVSFQLEPGDSLGLVGLNGAGKSTLLKLIAGIMEPTHGKVVTTGNIAPLIELSGGFDPALTAKENIFLVGAMHGHTRQYMKKQFDEIIDFAELQDFVDVPLRNYSSGMNSRLGFAIATLVEADILIADEVLSVGDAKFRKKCEQRISEMLKNGATVLFVSHSVEQVQKICKQALWLDHGEMKLLGPAAQVTKAYMNSLNG